MQPRPMAETERELPSVRCFNGGVPDSATLPRSSTRRPRPASAYGRDRRPSGGGFPSLRVSQDGLLSVLPGTWRPPAALAANGVPSLEGNPVAHPGHVARSFAPLLLHVDAQPDRMLER